MRHKNDCLALKRTANAIAEYMVADLIVYGAQGIIQQINIS
jgi:hypothetical protein